MLQPGAGEGLNMEARPRISISALLDLCELMKAQPSAATDNSHGCAEFARGGRDAQQGESGHTAAQVPLQRRRAMDEAAPIGAGMLPKSLQGTTGERSEEGGTEAG
jgi:hypothetical protein